MKKFFKGMKSVLCCLAVSCLVTSCAVEPETVHKETIVFGAMSAVDAVPVIIAKDRGFFEDKNVDVQVEVFKSMQDRDAALQAGELDGIICDVVAVLLFQNAGLDVKVTGITDGCFSLVAGAGSGIDNVSGANGKSVAISQNSVIEYSLDKLLEKAKIAEVEKVIVPPLPTRLEMMTSGNVDMALLPNPFTELAVSGGAKVIAQLDSSMSGYVTVSAFKQDSIEKKAEEIKAFYEAYNAACEYLNEADVSEYEDMLIEFVGYPEKMKGDITVPEFRKNTLPSNEDIQDVINWMNKKELLTKTFTISDITNDIGK